MIREDILIYRKENRGLLRRSQREEQVMKKALWFVLILVFAGLISSCGDIDCRDCECNSNCFPPKEYRLFYLDADHDGYGDPNIPIWALQKDDDYSQNNSDCDDSNADVHPGATEICDGLDNNCNGPDFICSTTIFSLNEYDGWWGGYEDDRVIMSIGFGREGDSNNKFIYTNYVSPDGYPNTNGLVTFDLGFLGNSQKITEAEIGIYQIDSFAYPYSPTVIPIISELLVPQADYAGWETCAHYTDRTGFSLWLPQGCLMPAHNYVTSDQHFVLYPALNGYWKTYASVLPDFLNSRKGSLLTFELIQRTYDSQGQETLNNSWWEDGGNHGGTGDVPYLEIIYEE